MFFTIFKDLCAKKNKTPTAVGNELGIAKTTISYWRKKQDILPKPDVLSKLSQYFDVPVSYFLGETDIKKPPITRDERIDKLYEEAKDLSDAEFMALRAYIAGLKANKKPR